MRRRRQAYEHKAAQGSASEGAACTVSRSTAARPRVPSTISGSSSDRATASANPTADRALDRPRLVPPERADLRPLSQCRSGVAVRSLDKPSGDTSERAMTRRVSTSRADATPCGPRHQQNPRGSGKIACFSRPRRFRLASTELPSHFHALPRRILRLPRSDTSQNYNFHGASAPQRLHNYNFHGASARQRLKNYNFRRATSARLSAFHTRRATVGRRRRRRGRSRGRSGGVSETRG